MSWSHNFTGEALEVARLVEKESANVQSYLSQHGEKAIHARITSLIVVACHEQKGHHVKVESCGYYDGLRQHFRVAVDGIETPVTEKTVDETTPAEESPEPIQEERKTRKRKNEPAR